MPALALLLLLALELAAASPLLVPYFKSTLRPCPTAPPADVDVDQLLGTWHLSLLLLDSAADAYPFLESEEALDGAPTCASVEVSRSNASVLQMDWSLHQLGVPGGLADLSLRVPAVMGRQPGVWALSTPLGGEMLSTVRHAAPRSFLVLSVCGDRGGSPVHLLTGLLTRSTPSSLGSLELLRLFRRVAAGGGFLQRLRLLSWRDC